jgi:ketopantoate reductase
MVMSSMAQDIIQRGGSDSELETINGYFIELADKHGMKVPYNRAIYALCKREFAKPKFEPLDVKEVLEEVEKKIQNGK